MALTEHYKRTETIVPVGLQNTIFVYKSLSKLQLLSFMFTSNFRRCPFCQNLAGGVLYLSKSCTFCPLDQTQLDFFVKSGHVQGT
ncbi:hypothetical protein HanXRQr2_Chr04g0145221 [Helianthus annuus]|uniref:Uncharacterized protein n=1 Tax=Helianthus annuus TaxID=4232 RepID=A0A251UYG6_HELAN|nr:hypothetical protein HanXRQr2_Chr04g0145221 [Helianthus annuus]KAJ0929668.1 hypothetical protein HanPSC8_Chr04g0140311 [Helianthus annuus]